jgi:hypothetical protein
LEKATTRLGEGPLVGNATAVRIVATPLWLVWPFAKPAGKPRRARPPAKKCRLRS